MSNNLTNSKSCMIYAMVLFPVTSVTLRFQGHWVIIDALNVLCAKLTRDLFAIAKFLFKYNKLTTSTKERVDMSAPWQLAISA